MNGIDRNTGDILAFTTPLVSTEQAALPAWAEAAERFFDWGQKGVYRLLNSGKNEHVCEYKVDYSRKTSALMTALKVIACLTLILPFIMLVLRHVYRLDNFVCTPARATVTPAVEKQIIKGKQVSKSLCFTLPKDVESHITGWLTLPDLARLSTVSRGTYALANYSVFWNGVINCALRFVPEQDQKLLVKQRHLAIQAAMLIKMFNITISKKLGIWDNNYHLDTISPFFLQMISKAQSLYIGGNGKGLGLKRLPNEFCELKKLTYLWLPGNQLKSLDLICQLTELDELGVHYNQIEQLPDNIGNIRYLSNLRLNNNPLGSNPFPASFSKLRALRDLWLSKCGLTEIPAVLQPLSNLQFLDVSGNALTTVPDWIGEMRGLSDLNLSNNRITQLPESLGNARFLRKLAIYGNAIAALPQSIKEQNQGFTLVLSKSQKGLLPAQPRFKVSYID